MKLFLSNFGCVSFNAFNDRSVSVPMFLSMLGFLIKDVSPFQFVGTDSEYVVNAIPVVCTWIPVTIRESVVTQLYENQKKQYRQLGRNY